MILCKSQYLQMKFLFACAIIYSVTGERLALEPVAKKIIERGFHYENFEIAERCFSCK